MHYTSVQYIHKNVDSQTGSPPLQYTPANAKYDIAVSLVDSYPGDEIYIYIYQFVQCVCRESEDCRRLAEASLRGYTIEQLLISTDILMWIWKWNTVIRKKGQVSNL